MLPGSFNSVLRRGRSRSVLGQAETPPWEARVPQSGSGGAKARRGGKGRAIFHAAGRRNGQRNLSWLPFVRDTPHGGWSGELGAEGRIRAAAASWIEKKRKAFKEETLEENFDTNPSSCHLEERLKTSCIMICADLSSSLRFCPDAAFPRPCFRLESSVFSSVGECW